MSFTIREIRLIRFTQFAMLFAVYASMVGAQEPWVPAGAQQVREGRFTMVAMPADVPLARNLLAFATGNDSFPGLPRPSRHVSVIIAPNEARFREWLGGGVPEWGIAVAIPSEQRVIMQGRAASSRAGNPMVTLRHELAHLALHEFTGQRVGLWVPAWLDEGYASYAAGEWSRDQVLASSFALAIRGVPHLATLDSMIAGGAGRAEQGYALAHRAVADMAAKDPQRGLTVFFRSWLETRRLDAAFRQSYGVTLEGFEAEWRRSTRRRYGAIALFADVGFASLVLFAVIAPFWFARRRRDRERLAALVAADARAERLERESALEALLGGGDAVKGPKDANDDQIKET